MSGHLDIPFHQGAGLLIPLRWGVGTSEADIDEFDLTGAVIELVVNGTTYLMDALEIRLTAAQTAGMPSSNYVVVVTMPGAEPIHVLEGKLIGAHTVTESHYVY